ncbi:hypothetical protein HH308_09010 [Gordonia sp. TBRC 11910]|uniref:Transcriptional regulator, AbiEi antitoxin, Type IV TA system n=1 Tax=Gordonia asplenii TaxID=2725283 RepID=A0A848KSW0_9ACTN|nr:type IV toxin-antitoxin system AbiEi family antitoxin domain-containing protein [Gordonia asplenii]NMO01352.1 hypothetical protein [Gordonia asplenii]
MHPFPIDGDGYIRADTALSLGFSPQQLQRAAAKGDLDWIASGVYAVPAERTPEAQHRFEVMAATTSPAVAVSHASAGVVHGLSMLDADLSRLHLTSATSDVGYKRTRRHVHPGPLTPDDIVQVDGLWVTSRERTAFDVARTSTSGFPAALAAFDSALRTGGDRTVMQAYGAQPRTGVGVARRALTFADPLSENAGESWGRAQMIEGGLVVPRLQHEVFDDAGTFIARTDYDWVDENGAIAMVGEFDGLGKYLKYLQPGEDAQDVIRREKRREGRLQDLGIIVVRWTWADLKAGRVVSRIVAQMRAIGLPTPPPSRPNPALARRRRSA